MSSIDTAIGIIGVITAIVVGIVVYYKAKKDSRKVKDELKKELTDTMVDIENASKRVGDGGKVAKRDDKVIAAHERNIHEPSVNVTDRVEVKVRRWHDDPNGSEIVNGRHGYYTDDEDKGTK